MRRLAAWTAVAVVAFVVAGSSLAEAPAMAASGPTRFGVVPHLGRQGHVAIKATVPLTYHGGRVTTGKPKVYIVYWGTQWGTSSIGTDGYTHFTGDPSGLAPYQQAFFTGLGTNGELWDGVMTQYCLGVATGATSCPSTATHVGYPTGGAVAGIWYDNSAAEPQAATQAQLAAEAVKAAQHFGNTTQAKNANAQYVITSPHGTNPDHYQNPLTGFCAWHASKSFTAGTATVHIAYTNMPYVPDVGATCGANFVNAGSTGNLDGVSIVNGHEYAETITDMFPSTGWIDRSNGENADKCAWISSGQGAAQNIALSTGSYAVQSTWANDFNTTGGGCEISHPIVTNG